MNECNEMNATSRIPFRNTFNDVIYNVKVTDWSSDNIRLEALINVVLKKSNLLPCYYDDVVEDL